MINQELVDYLRELEVCQACQLRYLKARGTEYKYAQETFEKLNVKFDDAVENTNDDHGVICKKPRRNVCPTCLGLFSQEFIDHLIERIISSDLDEYEFQNIVIGISLPMVLQLRQLAMWYALIKKFNDQNISSDMAPEVPLKEAIKLILNPILCEKLGKTYDANGLMINIKLNHVEEEDDVRKLAALQNIAFACKGKRSEISRGLLEKLYTPAQVKAELFERFFDVPPKIPNEGLTLGALSLMGPPVFLAGRYRKLSRALSHTPWVLNGVRIMDDSIEEIIIRNIAPYFCADTKKVTFMSSGREDVDVRCLGKGRPFALEIPNARRLTLSRNEAYRMEQAIDSTQSVSVRNLQVVSREDLIHIKTGEEKKRKFYRALCKLEEPATPELLDRLQLPDGFRIQQKTPLRVLHRRPLHTRPRMIYSLVAYVDPNDGRLLILDIVSQAGAYIKELIHGEFGRTTPCVASIIGQPIDILALDVVGIDLDWPADIDNSIE